MMMKTFALATATMVGLSASAFAAAPTYIYDVTVKTNFGTKFNDCFTFHAGTLTITGLQNYVLKYTAAPSQKTKYYQAVATVASVENNGINFDFAGFKLGGPDSGTLKAIGADDQHDSYTVKGTAVPACSGGDARAANWVPAAR